MLMRSYSSMEPLSIPVLLHFFRTSWSTGRSQGADVPVHLLQGPPLQPRLPEVSKRRGTPRSGEAPHHLHALPDPGAEPEVPAVAHGSVQMPYDEPRVLLLQVNGAQLGALSGKLEAVIGVRV